MSKYDIFIGFKIMNQNKIRIIIDSSNYETILFSDRVL